MENNTKKKMSKSKKEDDLSKREDNTNTGVVFPSEIVEEIVARLPFSRYIMAKRISKHIGEFINKGKVFKLRSSRNLEETLIHMAFSSTDSINKNWYVIEKSNDKKGYVLTRVPLPIAPSNGNCFVGAGRRIYVIGGSKVVGVDLGSMNMCEIPRMKATRHNPKAAVIKGKIYVFGGGCINEHFLEVFDPTQEEWKTVDIPKENRKIPLPSHIVVLDDKIHIIFKRGTQCFVFDPNTGAFERKDEASMGDRLYDTSCLVNNNLFTFGSNSKIEIFDSKLRSWEVVNGLPEFDILNSQLFSFNGQILVINQRTPEYISLTVITLHMRGNEISGHVESCDRILQLPPATIEAIVTNEA